ncbi:UDP-N-acetylmuramate dehydrogenase [Halopseudomonas xiamenensis]|uniref:UDP-N-acetylmuramate dehydrogenase n=1 Tax=Halopseudomonas xiamenensis TaxID=157792 RepID=UPI001625C4A1|nr:UDP-N-acetylmuramate dehydrogenase [Halopseudomonas xiamenensis]
MNSVPHQTLPKHVIARELKQLLVGRVDIDVPLDKISRWRIGGIADIIVQPRSIEDVATLRRWLHEREMHHVLIGETSNLLFSDKGVRSICIKMGSLFSEIDIQDNIVTAEAGVWVPKLARAAMKSGLTGLEHTCGIPGTFGGLIYMNGGSLRQGVGSVVTTVTSIDSRGEIVKRTFDKCDFSYRSSIYQKEDEIVVSASMGLSKASGGVQEVRAAMLEILSSRRKKFPRKEPNCGSVFISNPLMYEKYGAPGKVIEDSGYKGLEVGRAKVSDLHANFIVNLGGAKAVDVMRIIKKVRSGVENTTGYRMDIEARYVDSVNGIIPLEKAIET